jgi:ribonuclease HII
LIDGIFKEKFDTEKKYETIIKGDTKIYCIAAASIIAKVTRDKIMERLSLKYENFDFQSNKGYGTKFHIQQLKTLGPTDIHRLSFIKNII